jgi:hypothetical protein
MPPERYPGNFLGVAVNEGNRQRRRRHFRGAVAVTTPHRRELRVDQVPRVGLTVLMLLAGVAGCGNSSREVSQIAGPSSSDPSDLALEGVVTDVAGSCTTGTPSSGSLITFRVGGIPVLTDPNTRFTVPCPDIRGGISVAVRGPRFVNQALPASTVEAGAGAATVPRFEVTGRIESLARGFDCVTASGRRVTVAGWTFKVGNAFTRSRDVPGGCHGLVVGLRITSRGSLTNPPAAPLLPPSALDVELSK